MFTCQRISDVEYYLAEAEKAAEEGQKSERDRAAYYLDNGAGEDKGTWWSPANGYPAPLVQRGAEVSPWAFRAMARGCDPTTGEPLIQATRKERTAGYDCQFAAPKSVSVLWATATPEERAHVEKLHRAAVHRALDFAAGEGLIITRRGKGGMEKQAVADCAVAEFMHSTSRAGDPQLHSHAVLLNVCTRQEGSTGSLDNARILQYQGAMGAVYRAELAASLERELGLSTRKDERNFRVEGVPDEVTAVFSKRRAAIETAAEIDGYTTAGNRERARLAAVATREKKSDVPGREELEKRWVREVQAAGWSNEALWASARAARGRRDDTEAKLGIDPEAWRVGQWQRVALAAIETLEATDAVLERRHVVREVVERLQGIATADEALEAVERLERDGHLVRLPPRQAEADEDVCFASPGMIETEQQLIRGALERRGERDFVPREQVEAAISRRATMSEEQAAAVRHALNRDGVAVVEGSAGTGKSFSLGGVADAARDAGMHVFVVAPSHKAKDVIRHDTTTDEDSAKAVQGFNNRLSNPQHKEHVQLTGADVIIVDEAGMVGTRELAVLLAHAKAAGAKVVLAGDTRQLQPVSAGGPMAALASLCGTQRIEEIRRQKVDWQRAASSDFATGKADRALEAYDRAGRLHLIEGRDESLAALADEWRADVERNSEAGMAKPHEARLVVAGRNKDVHALNAVLRDAYRETGRLRGEDVDVRAFTRGQNGKLETMKIADGDRLIFGESVTVGGATANNSDMATVESIRPGSDPVVRLRFDKGDVIDARWSELVGRREEDAPDSDRHPKVQHAYAVTVHASQGTTVNRCFVYNAHGMGMESAYVSMTRHREDAAMFVDTSRIIDRLEARKAGSTMKVSKTGRLDARDADDEAARTGGLVQREELAAVVRHEVLRSEVKRNVSDFVEDKRGWAFGGQQLSKSLSPNSPEEEAAHRIEAAQPGIAASVAALDALAATAAKAQRRTDLEASLAALDAIVAQGAAAPRSPARQKEPTMAENGSSGGERPEARPAMPRLGASPFGGRPKTQAGQELQQRMEDRQRGPAYPMSRAPIHAPISHGVRGLSPEAELEAFAREIDLVLYLEKDGYRVAEKWTNGWKLKNGDDTLNVKHKERWVWTRPDGSQSGTIIAYLQKVKNVGNIGEVRKLLRVELGETFKPQAPRAAALDAALRTSEPPKDYDFGRVRKFWHYMSDGANEWLTHSRGLAQEVLDRFRADIRTEGSASKQNPGGACFAHRNEAGEVVGYQRKGPKHAETDTRGFSQWSAGGQKLFTSMGERETPSVIYFGETAIDLLSAYQQDGQPKGALLCAFDGGTSQEAMEEAAKLAAKHPEARLLVAFDNDLPRQRTNPHTGGVIVLPPAGDAMAQRLEAAIRARVPDAALERHFPPSEFKDWNDCLRGITREEVERRAAQADSRVQAAEAERVARLSLEDAQDAIRVAARELWEGRKGGVFSPAEVDARSKTIERMEAELAARRQQEEARKVDFAAGLSKGDEHTPRGPRR
jgi:conjugative relaxase-like TrwC/TraI family protein